MIFKLRHVICKIFNGLSVLAQEPIEFAWRIDLRNNQKEIVEIG
jgi:hypothetical protein